MSLQRFIYLWHLFAVLDYKKCYRALLYIGYDKKLQNCFNLTLNKKKYSNLLKIKDRSTYNVLVVDGGEMRGTVAQLFQESVEEGPISRNVHVYSGQKVSKVVNVFMIAQKHFSSFVKEDQLALK